VEPGEFLLIKDSPANGTSSAIFKMTSRSSGTADFCRQESAPERSAKSAAGATENAVHNQPAAAIIRLMTTPVIAIPVDASTADAYQSASADQQRQLQLLLRLRLRELTTRPARSLHEILDEVGRAAIAKGLTPESLSSILGER
jgi:hypothetical protein